MVEAMNKILVSACLLGQPVRYDGRDAGLNDATFRRWQHEQRLVAICPEMAGGLPSPRPPAEIDGGASEAVLFGRTAIRTREGADVTDAFMSGAELALAAARRHGIRVAILKEGSPSCGVHRVNDGTFSGRKVDGQGLTARLLARHGVRVFSEGEIAAAAAYVETLEAGAREGIDGQ
jgi:uncharacterized protein YbbK (DUF523 family)